MTEKRRQTETAKIWNYMKNIPLLSCYMNNILYGYYAN